MTTRAEVRRLQTIDRDLRKRLKAAGCTIEWTKGNHIRIMYQGKVASIAAGSPSDHRSRLNLIAQLRRSGVTI